MPGVLGALAGEQEGHGGGARSGPGAAAGSGSRAGEDGDGVLGVAATGPPRADRSDGAPTLQREGRVVRGRPPDAAMPPEMIGEAASRPRAAPRRLRADSSSSCRRRGRASAARAAGASSSTTWALVPPMPNELTPARRGDSAAGQSRPVGVDVERRLPAKSICGFGAREMQARRDLSRARSASTVLIRPATPAAASRWPMLVLTEPSAQTARPRCRRPKGLGERGDLDRIAERGAGAVRLDVADASRARHAAHRERRGDHLAPARRRSARCSRP